MIETIFGYGEHLNELQMSCRAFVMFFIALVLIRISGMRAFGTKSPFDSVVVIMLGAVLARGVVGASPFFSTVSGGLMITVIHRILAYISMKNHTAAMILKGKEILLYKNGNLIKENLEKCNLSHGDVLEGLRHNANISDLEEAEEIYMERNGHISVIKKKR